MRGRRHHQLVLVQLEAAPRTPWDWKIRRSASEASSVWPSLVVAESEASDLLRRDSEVVFSKGR